MDSTKSSHLGRLRANDWSVKPITIAQGKPFIEKYHYAKGASKAAVFVHGLFGTELSGVVWWLPPTKVAAQSVSPDWRGVLSLSRMAIAPGVPKNACSFLLGRSIRLIKQDGRFHTLLTYADEAEGHTGWVYRACNWKYLGKTKSKARWVDPDGRLVSIKVGPKTRTELEMLVLGFKQSYSCKHKYVYKI